METVVWKMALIALAAGGPVFLSGAQGQAPAATNAAARAGLRECPVGNAAATKYPEQVALITSADAEGKANIITVGWIMFCSGEPPMIAVSIGKTRYSHKLISAGKEFVCAFPGADLEREVLFCGTHSGKDVDKFKETGLTAAPAGTVKPPLIAECIANFECQVTAEMDAGDHTVFIGKIVKAWKAPERKEQRRLFSLGGRKFGGLP